MNRIATSLTILSAPLFLGAAEPAMQTLESRLSALEARLISIEKALTEEKGSYSYNNAATLEATNGGNPAPAPVTTPLSAPTPAAAPGSTLAATTPSGPSQTYVIQDGDTLGKIAGKFSVERSALLEANRLSEGQPIYIGETLLIPGSAPQPAPQPEVAKTPEKPEASQVQASIPAPPVPPTEGADAGKPAPVKKDSIVVGETKKQPAPAATKTHTVVKGDTLMSLSRKFNTSVESIKSANGLRSDTINLGQTLKIPTAASQASNTGDSEKPGQTSNFQYDNPLLKDGETYGYYTVVKDDNLYALARDFFTTMAELQRINNLGSSTLIHPGDDIIVPTSKYNAYHNSKNGEVANR
ncbi:MAG: LysM peptidoglycan-binding domain-containing protein [Verrucomicrobiae bacterium]|nr:LysM peptidoglycan-binding domain-containing protein [Verrucomicrobiae bacterium]